MPKVLARVASKTNQQRCTVQLLCTGQRVGGLREASANWQGARMQRSTRKYTRKKKSISHSGHAPYVDARRRGHNCPSTYRLGGCFLHTSCQPNLRELHGRRNRSCKINCTRLRSTWPHGRLASASGQCIVGELDSSPNLFDSCQHNLPAFHQRHGHRFRSQL